MEIRIGLMTGFIIVENTAQKNTFPFFVVLFETKLLLVIVTFLELEEREVLEWIT